MPNLIFFSVGVWKNLWILRHTNMPWRQKMHKILIIDDLLKGTSELKKIFKRVSFKICSVFSPQHCNALWEKRFKNRKIFKKSLSNYSSRKIHISLNVLTQITNFSHNMIYFASNYRKMWKKLNIIKFSKLYSH